MTAVIDGTNGLTGPATKVVVGTTTNDSAAAGYVGEIIESTVLIGSAVSLTTATPANVTSLSLTAGDWNVWGTVSINTSVGATVVIAGINTTSATLPTSPGAGAYASVNANLVDIAAPVGMTRISIASTTTVYLVIRATFGSGTCGGYGYIGARRMR